MRKWCGFRFIAAMAAGVVLVLSGSGSALALAPAAAESAIGPSVQSDAPDYMPGSTVVLTGAGWQPGEAVHLYVNDDQGRTWSRDNDVTAAADGTITDTFTLPDWFVATYRVTATGELSGVVTSTFTDGNIKLHVVPTGLALSFTAISYTTTTNCTGASTSTTVNPEGTISSGQATSALVHAPSVVSSTGTTYDFTNWDVSGKSITYAAVDGSSDICVTGFDSGSGDVTANYTARAGAAKTTTAVASNNNPSTYGNAVTFTATVTANTNPTAGSVTFTDGATTLCDSVPLAGTNQATCQTSSLRAASHPVTATYNPTSAYQGSSGSVTQVVNPRTVTGAFTASDKVYDGTTSATITGRSLTNVVGSDRVSLTGGAAAFADPNVGTNKAVTGTGFSLAGTDAGNYLLANSTLATAANITKFGVTASFAAADKTYDGNRIATISAPSLTGVKSGDSVSVSVATGGAGTFASKDAGNGIAVSAPTSSFDLSGASAGNYSITSVTSTSANITAKHITGSFTAASKDYDGTTSATVTDRSLDGVVGGDDVSLAGGTATFSDKAAGTGKTVTLSSAGLDGAAKGNYVLDSVSTANADIAPLHVTGAFTTNNKVYDGNTKATVDTTSVPDKIAGDGLTLTAGPAAFESAGVGDGKTVSMTGASLTGDDKGNYVLDGVADTTADITPKTVTGSFTAADKPYDGTTDATITGRSLSDVVGTDDVALTGGSASFATSHAGKDITVTGTGFSLGGHDAGNYALASSTLITTANITRLAVTGHVEVSDKTYDGDRSATVTREYVTGMVGSDEVTLTGGTASFDNKNAGTGKTVTLSGASLGGADAADYALDSAAPTTTADINPKEITGSFTAADKVYDQNVDAGVTGTNLDGVIGTDDVTLQGTASFNSASAGDHKTVTFSPTGLQGDDAGNYTLGTVSDTTAAITPRDVTVLFSSPDRTYNGTASASITDRALQGLLTGDTVTVTGGSAHFADKNVGTGKIVSASGFTLGGSEGGNYQIGHVQDTTANITRLEITGSFTAANRVYDATTAVTITGRSLHGTIDGDDVSLTGGTASFEDKNVGTGKTVTLTGAGLDGADAGNYSLKSTTLTTTADITAASLTGSFTAKNKVYDGTRDAEIDTRSLTGEVSGDDVTLTGGSAAFGDKNVGTSKTVTGNLSDFALDGTDAKNYILTSVDTTSASITKRDLTIGFSAAGKVYDGNADAQVTGAAALDAVTNDKVEVDPTKATGTFASKDAGTRSVTATGFTLTGDDAGNYVIKTVQPTTAEITPKLITGSFTAQDKTYDGNVSATVLTQTPNGVIGQDSVSLTGGTASFEDKKVGTGKEVTLEGAVLSGDDAGNYTLASVGTTTADITPLGVTASFTAADKTYDGKSTATVVTRSLAGTVSGDEVSLAGDTASFGDKNAGTGKEVTLTDATLVGDDSGNYTISNPEPTTTANITQLEITGSFTAANKTYDATTDATITDRSLHGTIEGDQIRLTGGGATFADKNVGTGKTVTLTDAGLAGTDAGNYSLKSTTLSTTADITAASLTGSFTAKNKVYDGTRAAEIDTRSLTGMLRQDTVTLTGGTATFADKNVGAGKTVTGNLSDFSLDGTDAKNYDLTSVGTTTADITQRGVTASLTAANRIYDGKVSATVTGRSLTNTIEGDDISLTGGSATFEDKNVGTGKTVTLTGAALSGKDAGNYTIVNPEPTTTADITPLSVTGSFTSADKTYDGTRAAAATGRTLAGTVSGDDVSLTGGTASFADKNVGTSKTVTLTGATLSGADARNYDLTSVDTTTAAIRTLAVTGSFTAANKVYDGNASATVTGRSLLGTVAGDDISLTGGTASFGDKNAGTGKTVTLTGAGLAGKDAGNYTLTSVATTTADITPAPLTITADNATMVLGAALPSFTGTVTSTIPGEAIDLVFHTDATSSSPIGTYAIVPSVASDSTSVAANYKVTAVNGTLSIVYRKDGFLQPVNDTAHQTGPISVFNAGQTIPLKFQLKNAAGQLVQARIAPQVLNPVKLGSNSAQINETSTVTSATPGTTFVWDGSQYQYNWKTSKSQAGSVWQVGALLDDGTTQAVLVGLR